MNARMVLLALLVAALPGTAIAAEPLALKPSATVTGPDVRLWDVVEADADALRDLQNVVLRPAARPGQSVHVQAALVQARLEEAGYRSDEFDLGGADLVEVHTPAVELTRETVEDSLRAYIEREMPWSPEEAFIDLQAPSFNIDLPVGEVTFRWRPAPRYQYLGTGSFRGEVLVDGEPQRTVVARANIEAYGDVVVALNDIPRGKVVTPNDVDIEERAMSALPRGAVRSIDEVLGQVARSTIFPGQVLTGRRVEARKLFLRGQLVPVEAKAGGLTVRTVAKAREDGVAGDVVRCQNADSEREFWGTVREDGVVVVE